MLVSAREASARAGVSERTVRRWIAIGELAAQRRGRSFSIDLGELERAASKFGHKLEEGEDLHVLRGRYLELREQLARLEATLKLEREANAALRAQLGVTERAA